MDVLALSILRWSLTISFWSAVVFGFVLLLNLVVSGVLVVLNIGIVADLFTVFSMWLPFNFGGFFLYLITAGSLLFTFKLGIIAYNFINDLMGYPRHGKW